MTPAEQHELTELLQHAKHLAQRYRELTGRPLGITGEIAESEAVRLLGLELAPVRSPGYDVIRRHPDGTEQHLQVKGRVLPATHKLSGQRICGTRWHDHAIARTQSMFASVFGRAHFGER